MLYEVTVKTNWSPRPIIVVVQNWRHVRSLMRRRDVVKVVKTSRRFAKFLGPAMRKKLQKYLGE